MTRARPVVGWDVGGAHLKACLLRDGRVLDVAQWLCPLWQGLDHLDAALAAAAARWPAMGDAAHAVTMTGEMVDLFAEREAGVRTLARHLDRMLPGPVRFFAGAQGWCDADGAAALWPHIASANWLATATLVARWAQAQGRGGVLVDLGSTTTDLIAFDSGAVIGDARSDADRLASGELVYHGVVRTPLCALARQVPVGGVLSNVMNEFFATTADIYRLTGELDPAHDLHPSADGAPKTPAATRQRLARMVGRDAREAADADWLALALAWRAAQVAEIAGQLLRVMAARRVAPDGLVVSAGCGAFLAPSVLAAAGLGATASLRAFGGDVVALDAQAEPGAAAWAQVCAPSVASALLFDRERRTG